MLSRGVGIPIKFPPSVYNVMETFGKRPQYLKGHTDASQEYVS